MRVLAQITRWTPIESSHRLPVSIKSRYAPSRRQVCRGHAVRPSILCAEPERHQQQPAQPCWYHFPDTKLHAAKQERPVPCGTRHWTPTWQRSRLRLRRSGWSRAKKCNTSAGTWHGTGRRNHWSYCKITTYNLHYLYQILNSTLLFGSIPQEGR